MLNKLFTKYATQTLVGIALVCVAACAALFGIGWYVFVQMASVTTVGTISSASSSGDNASGYIPIAGAATVDGSKVKLNLKNTEVSFNYDKEALGEAAVLVSDFPPTDLCFTDRRYGSVEFPKSDIKIGFNLCGLGGISEVLVDSFKVKAKSGQTFTIAYTNCVNVKETYDDQAQYQRDLETIGKTCRSYALSSHFIGKKIAILFMFETTPDKVPQINTQIRSIVRSMVIKEK